MKILAINPGSTSTKIAVMDGEQFTFEKTLYHHSEEIEKYDSIGDQYEFRQNAILAALKHNGLDIYTLDAVVGRGGLLRPMQGGTYVVNAPMLKDLSSGIYGEHASNLGGIIANHMATLVGIPAYIVDPVVVDEMQEVARLSGHPKIERKSIWHALNQKAVGRKAAQDLNKRYEDSHLIIAHLGGGISVGLHRHGCIVDVNNALDGEGPFSPERSGGLPVGDLISLCYSGKYSEREIRKLIKGQGGLVAYLNTNDGREVIKRISAGDAHAELVYRALAYQIAKEIGGLAAVNKGQVDAIVLTGGLAYDRTHLITWISEAVSFIAPVLTYPGENEMEALCAGAERVLNGVEDAKSY